MQENSEEIWSKFDEYKDEQINNLENLCTDVIGNKFKKYDRVS